MLESVSPRAMSNFVSWEESLVVNFSKQFRFGFVISGVIKIHLSYISLGHTYHLHLNSLIIPDIIH